ncbi:RNA-binding protein 28 [Tachypleus tridentatus]|uniref:RNA-binding protein 28 n=1 Tax=Tachypleus tridentatus TaxID=6853 RepID=UPI003FD3DF79
MAAFTKEMCTLRVTNLPQDATKQQVENIFSDIGPVKKCIVVKKRGENEDAEDVCTGVAYVVFAVREDAVSATERSFKIGEQNLQVSLAQPKKNSSIKKQYVTKEIRQQLKEKIKSKKGRLIIRNLSFKATDEKIKKTFSKFGNITEITIPKKEDGKMKGFAFVQFEKTSNAIKAINSLNAKEFLGRPIAVDFSLPKLKYKEVAEKSVEQQQEPKTEKCEDDPGSEDVKDGEKNASDNEDESNESESEDDEEENSTSDVEGGEEEDDDDDDDKSSTEEQKSKNDKENKSYQGKKVNVQSSKDIAEGRTLFIRNVAFHTTTETLNEAMAEFGPVNYALLCMDALTEHPKGSAFVQFLKKEDADKCLNKANDESQNGGIILDGRKLNISVALGRTEIQKKVQEKQEKKPNDRRNLYLAREGQVRAGSMAAEGVSQTDLAKRMQLETRKQKLLRNYQYFISPVRLMVHNLPASVDDRRLKGMFLQAVGDHKARITEARVMCNLKQIDTKKLGKSKGFGFVAFTEHKHALKALRELNNNPDIFTVKKRPIVEFSVENRAALNAKARRLVKSRENLKKKGEGGLRLAKVPWKLNKKEKKRSEMPPQNHAEGRSEEDGKSYMGSKAKEGMKGLSSHFGPKIRHKRPKLQTDNLEKNPKRKRQEMATAVEKHLRNNFEDTSVKKKQKKNQRRKSNNRQQDDNFSRLVEQYKQKLMTSEMVSRRSKWFEES